MTPSGSANSRALSIRRLLISRLILVFAPLLLAQVALGQAIGWNPPEPAQGLSTHEPHLEAARSLIRQGKLPEAEKEIQAVLDSGHDCYDARALLGLIRFHQNRPADSLAEFTRAAEFQKPSAGVLTVVALDYVKLDDLASADKWISAAIRMEPADAIAWRYLGGIRYGENRFDDAIKAYQECLKLHPEDVPAEDGLGRSMEGLNREDEAGAAYRTALDWQARSKSSYPQPLLHLGSLLLRQGRAGESLTYLLQADALSPGDPETMTQLGMAYTQLKQFDKAQSELERAVAAEPGNSHIHWLLAGVYRKQGLTEKAEEENRKFAALVGTHSNDKTP